MTSESGRIVYLWNWYRTRRHISTGESYFGSVSHEVTLCGQSHLTRAWNEATLRRRYPNPSQLQTRLAMLDAVPVCKHCQRAADARTGRP